MYTFNEHPQYVPPGSVTVQTREGSFCTVGVKWERVGNTLVNTERVELPAITSGMQLMGLIVKRMDGTDLRMELKNPICAESGAIIGFNARSLRIELQDHLYAFPGTELEEDDYEEDDDDWAGPNDDEPEEAPLAAAQADVVDRLNSLSINVQVKEDLERGQWLVDPETWGALYGAWSKRHASKRESDVGKEMPLAAAQDELAAIYAETGRRLGRTTRLLGIAVRRALAGEKVAFVTHNRLMQREAWELLRKHYADRAIFCGGELAEYSGRGGHDFRGHVRVVWMSLQEQRLYWRDDAVYDHVVVEEYGAPFVPRADAPKLPDYRFPVVAGIEHGHTEPSSSEAIALHMREHAEAFKSSTVNERPFLDQLEKLGIKLQTSSYVKPGMVMLVSPQDCANMQAETPRERVDRLRVESEALRKKHESNLRLIEEMKKSGHVSPGKIREILAPENSASEVPSPILLPKTALSREESTGLSLAELHNLDVERALSAMKP
jgi:hypothetical protein